MHLDEAPQRVYKFLATDEGRKRFWAESAVETDGEIEFVFPSGETYFAEILATDPYDRFVIAYFDRPASFRLREDECDGTIITLTHHDIEDSERCELMAGWVSVMLAFKGAVNFEADLRNHDPRCTWRDNFVGN